MVAPDPDGDDAYGGQLQCWGWADGLSTTPLGSSLTRLPVLRVARPSRVTLGVASKRRFSRIRRSTIL